MDLLTLVETQDHHFSFQHDSLVTVRVGRIGRVLASHGEDREFDSPVNQTNYLDFASQVMQYI